jgi:hypothetical protein
MLKQDRRRHVTSHPKAQLPGRRAPSDPMLARVEDGHGGDSGDSFAAQLGQLGSVGGIYIDKTNE